MTRTRCVTTSLVVSAVLIAVAGCTQPQPQPTSTVTPTSTTSTTTITPSSSTSTSLSPSEAKVASASAVVRGFWATQDQLRQNANLPIAELAKVTRGTAYETWAQQVQYVRVKQYRQVGDSQLLTVNGAVASGKTARPTVGVTVCYDVSKVDVLDRTGKSILKPNHPIRGKASYTVEQFKDGWFITDDVTKGQPCDA